MIMARDSKAFLYIQYKVFYHIDSALKYVCSARQIRHFECDTTITQRHSRLNAVRCGDCELMFCCFCGCS